MKPNPRTIMWLNVNGPRTPVKLAMSFCVPKEKYRCRFERHEGKCGGSAGLSVECGDWKKIAF
jgi:hypothetical protein